MRKMRRLLESLMRKTSTILKTARVTTLLKSLRSGVRFRRVTSSSSTTKIRWILERRRPIEQIGRANPLRRLVATKFVFSFLLTPTPEGQRDPD